ncbi:MAG: protein kinase domain-containing protein [Planctomycetota bacterium]|jgi:serine/threonine protein kinase/tetratricopeptide (TPR) repeat protein
MTSERFHQIEDLFHKARVLEPADRASFLDRECDGALDLREEIESLLAHADRGTSQMDLRRGAEGAPATIVDRGRLTEGPGTRIGPYKILQMIGEGGFGAVYMAEQEEPVQRKVALKIIKLGMDTKQVIARFEAERQALAMMEHPNIARVLEAGATETGRPYFVMELVKGIPITEYCDNNNLDMRERLDLFMQVCRAVQHAHQKGIIHRDIKPSNVMVTLHDSRPVPKVIDFGIAKATSRRLTEKTLFTEFRQFIGTPEYMSPDQAEMSGLDVDTRTDIYSLGVLLYELLTGTTPFDAQTLRSAGYGEIQRIIREEEPPKPSTRVNTLLGDGDGGGLDIARHRRTEPDTLSRLMRGDLDWIVMKAMEKDRTRRYETANELATDVQRYLNDEPVLAGPPSVGYKLRKFVRRHRVGVIATGLIAAALVAGLSLATVFMVQARREAARTRAVNDFLQELTTQIETATGGGGMTAGEIIVRGRELLGDDHAVIGTLLMTRASSLSTAGRLDEAIEAQGEALALFRKANTGDHPSTGAALSSLSKLLCDRRDYADAEETWREALAMKRRLYGDESEQVADELSGLAELLRQTGDTSRNDEIKQLWYETVAAYEAALGESHRKRVIELCQLGRWLQDNNYRGEAEPLLVEAVERSRDVLGDDLNRFVALNALGQLEYMRADIEAVIPLVEEMIVLVENVWGPGHPARVHLIVQQIGFLHRTGDPAAAGRLLGKYLQLRRETSPECNVMLLGLEEQLFGIMKDWFDKNPAVGRDYLLQATRDAAHVLGADGELYGEALEDGGTWLYQHGYDAEAEPLFEQLVGIRRQAEAPDKAKLAYALVLLGGRKVNLNKPVEAEPILRESLELRREVLSRGSWLVGSVESILGESVQMQGRFEEAEPLLLNGCAIMAKDPDAPEKSKREGVERLVRLYEGWGKPVKAIEFQTLLEKPIDPACCDEAPPPRAQ